MEFALYITYDQQHQYQNFISRDFSLEIRKTTKVSKAYPSDFASHYVLEIAGYSEGFQGQRKTLVFGLAKGLQKVSSAYPYSGCVSRCSRGSKLAIVEIGLYSQNKFFYVLVANLIYILLLWVYFGR